MILHKPVYEFHSVFAPSIYEYLSLKEALGEKITSPGNLLRQFDRYCLSINLQEPRITSELAENWFLTKADEKQETRSHRVSALWCFARHFPLREAKSHCSQILVMQVGGNGMPHIFIQNQR